MNLKFFYKELFPAFHCIFLVAVSTSFRPPPKRMSFLSGLMITYRFKKNLTGFENLLGLGEELPQKKRNRSSAL
ncbi:hypothetical protein ACFFG8_03160 [Chryseobacterium scophthalmum]